MKNEWEPTESDCQWLKLWLNKLKIGGLWRTSFGLYQKTGDNSLKLLVKIYAPKTSTDGNITRTKKAVGLIGWEYNDKDTQIVIATENPMDKLRNGQDFILVKDDNPIIASLNQCPQCGYWFDTLKCPNCGTTDSGFKDHRHGRGL